jgi:integrase/recombinase XerD
MSKALVPVVVDAKLPAILEKPHAIVATAGRPAARVWRDFFQSVKLKNPNTHRAYNYAVNRFLDWCQQKGLKLARIMPGDVAEYLNKGLGGAPSTQKVHRSAIKKFFDPLVVAHVCIVNPAVSVSTPTIKRSHGSTPMIEPDEIEQLIASIENTSLAGLRDRTAMAILGYTACRAGAVAKLRRGHYRGRPGRRQLYFQEKGGKHEDIEVRGDLEEIIDRYLAFARMKTADPKCPLFRPLLGTTQAFRDWVPATNAAGDNEQGAMSPNDVCRMVKRRMRKAGLREELSAHSFRTAVATNLIGQGVPVEDVQELLGHADARTTKLYDRTERKVTRNLVERIGLKLTDEVPAGTAAGDVPPDTLKVELFLVVENNSKFVRGKGKSTREIEDHILSRYNMQKPDKNGYTYILDIPNGTDEKIEEFVYDELLGPANTIADYRHGFLQETGVMALDDSERNWG